MIDMVDGLARKIPDGLYAYLLGLKEGVRFERYNRIGECWRVSNGENEFFIPTPKMTMIPFAFDVPWWEIKPGVRSVYEKIVQVEKGDVVMDVGAFAGSFGVSVSGRAKVIVCVEPVPKNTVCIRKNLTGRNTQSYIIKKAVSDEKGEKEMNLSISESNHSFRDISRKDGTLKVKTDTVDNIVKNIGLNQVDFLKINTEGDELSSVRGVKDWSLFNKIVVATHRKHSGESRKKICEILKSEGFLTAVCDDNLVHAY